MDKNSELVRTIKELVDKEYEDGRVTVMTDSEIVAFINRVCLEKNLKIGQ